MCDKKHPDDERYEAEESFVDSGGCEHSSGTWTNDDGSEEHVDFTYDPNEENPEWKEGVY